MNKVLELREKKQTYKNIAETLKISVVYAKKLNNISKEELLENITELKETRTLSKAIPNDKSNEPSKYDILSCLVKYDPGTLGDFCSEFGYDTDSRKAEKIYNAVEGEWLKVQSLFNDDELEILREIN